MNLRAVAYMLGVVLLLLAGFLLAPAAVAFLSEERRELAAFLLSSLACAALGSALALLNRGSTTTAEGKPDFFRREGLAVAGLAWFVAGIVGALPYLLTGTFRSFPDAFFESVSGFTTTGSTVLAAEGIDGLARSVAFWRSFTQWLGGFGIVMVFVVLFPTGGRSLFRSEVPGIAKEATTQRVRDSALGLLRIYLILSGLTLVLLWIAGMGLFDATIHTFSTLSTGGFSNRSASVAHYDSVPIELIVVSFAFVAGITFAIYERAFRIGPLQAGRQLVRTPEVRLYAGVVAAATLIIACSLWLWGGSQGAADAGVPDYRHFSRALRDSLFQVVSIQTTTGFATADFDRWPELCRVLLMGLAFVGGCAGSTAGGLKLIRFLIVARAAMIGVRRFMRPRAVLNVKVGDETLPEGIVAAVTGYFCLWVLVFIGGTLSVAAFGIEVETAATGVLATLNNIGPGLHGVGPAEHFGHLPSPVKLLFSIFMILGRLEFYAVVVLFAPSLWRR